MNSVPDLRVRAATSADQAKIRELLIGANLPVTDLGTASGLHFWVAESRGEIIGAIGLEPHGAAGLLRSLVVTASRRESGVGRELVAALEREARAARLRSLVLLTEGADRFFAQLGYAALDRRLAPEEIRHSAEFRTLCPASAICMSKSLAAGAKLPHG